MLHITHDIHSNPWYNALYGFFYKVLFQYISKGQLNVLENARCPERVFICTNTGNLNLIVTSIYYSYVAQTMEVLKIFYCKLPSIDKVPIIKKDHGKCLFSPPFERRVTKLYECKYRMLQPIKLL